MRALLQRIARAPGGRRGKWAVLAAWLIVAVALGPLAGKLGDVEDTGPNAFLPHGAESARVNTELEKFRTDTVMPVVVVYTGAGAREAADADRAALDRFTAPGRARAPGRRRTPTAPRSTGSRPRVGGSPGRCRRTTARR
nr:hypothetical protein [Streptomyces gancidicus]